MNKRANLQVENDFILNGTLQKASDINSLADLVLNVNDAWSLGNYHVMQELFTSKLFKKNSYTHKMQVGSGFLPQVANTKNIEIYDLAINQQAGTRDVVVEYDAKNYWLLTGKLAKFYSIGFQQDLLDYAEFRHYVEVWHLEATGENQYGYVVSGMRFVKKSRID